MGDSYIPLVAIRSDNTQLEFLGCLDMHVVGAALVARPTMHW